MDVRIVHRDAFYIVGFHRTITLQFHGENHQIDPLYEKLTEEARAVLLAINDQEPKGIVSVSCDFADRTREGSTLEQWLAVVSGSGEASPFDALAIPSSDWAVFSVCGRFPDALQEAWAAAYGQWLATSGYALTGGPEILWSESGDTCGDDLHSEIWIPVRHL